MNSDFLKIYLLSCAINDVTPDKTYIKDADWQDLLNFYSYQGLEFLVFSIIKNLNIPNYDKWEQKINLNLKNYLIFENERHKLYKFLDDNKIWYVPLKGLILKKYYPEPFYRTMSDNDILFNEDYCECLISYFKKNKYKYIKDNSDKRHVCFHKKPCLNFEMHKCLFVDNDNEYLFHEFFKNLDNRLVGDGYFKKLSDEDFYIYFLCHYRKHFAITGAGIRPIVDMYYYLKNVSLNWDYIDPILDKLNLKKFEGINKSLGKKLFSKPSKTYNLSKDEDILLKNALINSPNGTLNFLLENRVKETVKNKVNIFVLLFPNMHHMRQHGLTHAKYFWLLPFYWIQYNHRRLKTYGYEKSIKSFNTIRKSKKKN